MQGLSSRKWSRLEKNKKNKRKRRKTYLLFGSTPEFQIRWYRPLYSPLESHQLSCCSLTSYSIYKQTRIRGGKLPLTTLKCSCPGNWLVLAETKGTAYPILENIPVGPCTIYDTRERLAGSCSGPIATAPLSLACFHHVLVPFLCRCVG